ncbi:MAG TPA: TIM barrel protein [Pirellulales bacterium]|jgi:hydroxypyruvate isomerase|nr:TIM barrel protein [Pirellulales bacterium]
MDASGNQNAADLGNRWSRRHLLSLAAAGAAGMTQIPKVAAAAVQSPAVKNGRIKQSIVFWCFNVAGERWDIETMCRVTKGLGCPSVEIVDPKEWGVLKQHGLICAIAPNGMPGAPFMKGFNNPKYHDEVIARTKKTIDACADAGFPSVIAFTGYKWRDAEDPKSGEISREEGADNCVAGLKKIMPYAEEKGVTICVEHLNTRDNTHPMKGHPGYQGDDVDYVAEILRRVDSPRAKLLFDVYHVQIMNGDIIRRIGQLKDVIGHVHTAGVPGRGELDADQEVQYPPIMRKLLEVGYTGYVGQEFIPTRNPLEGLQQAISLCDV